jgi:hypothetical protein
MNMPKPYHTPKSERDAVRQRLAYAEQQREQAQRRQERSLFQCIDCHAPDGEHTGDCEVRGQEILQEQMAEIESMGRETLACPHCGGTGQVPR